MISANITMSVNVIFEGILASMMIRYIVSSKRVNVWTKI